MSQGALFEAAPPVAGLAFRDGILSLEEESALLGRLERTDLSPFRFQQWEAKRLTRTFGWRFDFETGRFEPGEPFPDWLIPVRDRGAAFAGLDGDLLRHCLVARYDPGAGIGWHKDRPVFGAVIGLSLGSPAVLRFRQRLNAGGFRRFTLPLPPRSAYLLSGEARHEWEHGIVPGEDRRFSITFRTLSEAGRRKAGV